MKTSKYVKDKNLFIETPTGFKQVEYIHKTEKLETLKIFYTIDNTLKDLTVSENHIFINDGHEIYASSLKVGDLLDHIGADNDYGKAIIVDIKKKPKQVHYDFSLMTEDELYISNGLISHNSGKTITTGSYLTWIFNFKRDMNIGIVANRSKQAMEFLHQVKEMLVRLPIWLSQGIKVWNKTNIENELGMRILTDVPSSDSFRGYTISVLVVDECAFIRSSDWDAFSDSVFPSQSGLSWKKNIIISTANGLNHFYHIVQRAKENKSVGTTIEEVKWNEVPRYDSKGVKIPNNVFKRNIISKYGSQYFEQNYGNNFLGSSNTLIEADIIKKFTICEPLGKLDSKLKVYEEPLPNHTYIFGIDTAKDGKDHFAVQVLDVTYTPFKQVACANLKCDYFTMPYFLNEWGQEYNNALMIIENNEGSGQSCADMLNNIIEYPNVFYDKDGKKRYPGFRTTKKTREQILNLLKLFANHSNLIISDDETVDQISKFEEINGKYQGSDGKDDLVMSLALCFAVFKDLKKIDDVHQFIKAIKTNDKVKTSNYISIGDIAFLDI